MGIFLRKLIYLLPIHWIGIKKKYKTINLWVNVTLSPANTGILRNLFNVSDP